MSLTIESHPYFPSRREDVNILDAQNYDDEREAMNHAVNSVSIPSRYVSNGFLELFILYQGNRQKYGERGLKTIIDVDYLPRGEHFLKVDVQNIEEDSLFWKELAVVPFWKE